MRKPIEQLALCLAMTLAVTALPSLGKGPRVLSGAESFQQVSKLTHEIAWYPSLNQALAAAKQQNKLVFYVHMLGSMSGAT